MTVGKFYATFLIQDYFRRFKKKKESKMATENSDCVEDKAVTLQVSMRIKPLLIVIMYFVLFIKRDNLLER